MSKDVGPLHIGIGARDMPDGLIEFHTLQFVLVAEKEQHISDTLPLSAVED